MSLARPAAAMMRRPLQNDIKKHILIAFGLGAISGIGWKVLVSDKRKAAYQEFYKYDFKYRCLKFMNLTSTLS